MDSVPQTKRCSKCKDLKPLASFGLKANSSDGLNWWCRECSRSATKAYRKKNIEKVRMRAAEYATSEAGKAAQQRYRHRHREEIKRRHRQRYERDPDHYKAIALRHYHKHRDSILEALRNASPERRARRAVLALRWRRANIEKVRQKDRASYHCHADARRAVRRAWAKANRAKARAQFHRYKAQRLRAPGRHTGQQFEEMCRYYGGKCLHCGRADIPLTADHIIPLSRGGTNDIGNIQPLCLPCNSSKGNRVIADYRPDKGAHFAPQQALLFE